MLYIKLIYNFILIGFLSIGGGYTAIPLIRDVSQKFGGLSDEMISNFIAISESTPGPLLVNLATLVGSMQAGVVGAILATVAVILPAFIIILVFAIFSKKITTNQRIKKAFLFIRPCIIGIIMSVGIYMFCENSYMLYNMSCIRAIIIAILIVLIMAIYKKLRKKKIGAISIIILGAILGIAINLIM